MLCLPVIQYQALGHFLVAYPELHLLTLALVLALSSYKGKRPVDLPGLSWLGWPPARKKLSKADIETV